MAQLLNCSPDEVGNKSSLLRPRPLPLFLLLLLLQPLFVQLVVHWLAPLAAKAHTCCLTSKATCTFVAMQFNVAAAAAADCHCWQCHLCLVPGEDIMGIMHLSVQPRGRLGVYHCTPAVYVPC